MVSTFQEDGDQFFLTDSKRVVELTGSDAGLTLFLCLCTANAKPDGGVCFKAFRVDDFIALEAITVITRLDTFKGCVDIYNVLPPSSPGFQ